MGAKSGMGDNGDSHYRPSSHIKKIQKQCKIHDYYSHCVVYDCLVFLVKRPAQFLCMIHKLRGTGPNCSFKLVIIHAAGVATGLSYRTSHVVARTPKSMCQDLAVMAVIQ